MFKRLRIASVYSQRSIRKEETDASEVEKVLRERERLHFKTLKFTAKRKFAFYPLKNVLFDSWIAVV